MKTRHYFLLWISFFLTTAIVFGAIAIPSYHYWSRAHDVARSLLFGAVGSLTFGIIYASYKLKTLHEYSIELDFTDLAVDPREYMGKELRRLGYRELGGDLFPAGFRADYYMAPDISLKITENKARLTGPKFYLVKLFKRHRRFSRRHSKK